MNGVSPLHPFTPTDAFRGGGASGATASIGYVSDSIARPKTDQQIGEFIARKVLNRSDPMIRVTMTVAEAAQHFLSLNEDPLKPFHHGSTKLADSEKLTVWFEKNATTKAEKAKKFDNWKDAKVVGIYRHNAARDAKPIANWSNHNDFGAWNGQPTHLKVGGLRLLAKRLPANYTTNWKNAWGGIVSPTASAGSTTVWLGSVLGRNGVMWGLAYLARVIANQSSA